MRNKLLRWTRLWCASRCQSLHTNALDRFHCTCLSCRLRRRLIGKFTDPPYWIDYTMPHSVQTYALTTRDGVVLAYQTRWETIKVDPRGHFTMLRCAFIICLVKIIARFRRTAKPLQEFCELAANYPTF